MIECEFGMCSRLTPKDCLAMVNDALTFEGLAEQLTSRDPGYEEGFIEGISNSKCAKKNEVVAAIKATHQ